MNYINDVCSNFKTRIDKYNKQVRIKNYLISKKNWMLKKQNKHNKKKSYKEKNIDLNNINFNINNTGISCSHCGEGRRVSGVIVYDNNEYPFNYFNGCLSYSGSFSMSMTEISESLSYIETDSDMPGSYNASNDSYWQNLSDNDSDNDSDNYL